VKRGVGRARPVSAGTMHHSVVVESRKQVPNRVPETAATVDRGTVVRGSPPRFRAASSNEVACRARRGRSSSLPTGPPRRPRPAKRARQARARDVIRAARITSARGSCRSTRRPMAVPKRPWVSGSASVAQCPEVSLRAVRRRPGPKSPKPEKATHKPHRAGPPPVTRDASLRRHNRW